MLVFCMWAHTYNMYNTYILYIHTYECMCVYSRGLCGLERERENLPLKATAELLPNISQILKNTLLTRNFTTAYHCRKSTFCYSTIRDVSG